MMVEAANKYKVATQMGNQGYSNEGTRQCAEMIWAGEIGNVTEVHAWTDRPIWPQGLTEIPAPTPVPPTLDWDLWLGIAELPRLYIGRRRLSRSELRRQLLPAFQLARVLRFRLRRAGRHGVPHSGRAQHGAETGRADAAWNASRRKASSNFQFPKKSTIRFEFPARGNMPPVKLYWYDGLKEQPEDQGRAGRRISRRSAPHGRRWRGRAAARVRRQRRALAAAVAGPDQRAVRRASLPLERCVPAGRRAPARDARWQPVHRRQGHDHHRHLWRTDAPDAGGEDAGLQVPAASVDPFARATTAIGSAPAKAATRPVPTSTWRRRSWSGCCWA